MQPEDKYDSTLKASSLRSAGQAHGGASKELVTRLESYEARLKTAKAKPETATELLVDGLCASGSEWNAQRSTLKEYLGPLVVAILQMEQRWFHNLRGAHESAEKFREENEASFASHQKNQPPHQTVKESIDRLEKRKETVTGWQPGTLKWKNLDDVNDKLRKANERNAKLDEANAELYGKSFFEGLRLYWRGAGFLVAPSYLPPAAIFPSDDWVVLDNEDTKPAEALASTADDLMKKYRVLGTPYAGMLYRDPRSKGESGCVCISWVLATLITTGKRVLVPVLGMSGKAPTAKNVVAVEAMLGACALPPYWSTARKSFGVTALLPVKSEVGKQLGFNEYYDDIMARANNLAINYRVRELLRLRLPSRQAMLSYLGLSFFVISRKDVANRCTLAEPTPGVTQWHSLNCAEPAALAWISSFFVDGQDVHLCCPYEGSDDPGALGLKPKETCPWCATVELAYRSLAKVSKKDSRNWPKAFEQSMATGQWAREITVARTFDQSATDSATRVDLPRNKPAIESAYPGAVNDNVAVLREIFKEVGLLNEDTVREGVRAPWQEM